MQVVHFMQMYTHVDFLFDRMKGHQKKGESVKL